MITVENTNQSQKVNERRMVLTYGEFSLPFKILPLLLKLRIHKYLIHPLNTLNHRSDSMVINFP